MNWEMNQREATMQPHQEPHPLAEKVVTLNLAGEIQGLVAGAEFEVADYWNRISGKSWSLCDGNPACLVYAIRAGSSGLPTDDDVVYGKVAGFGYLVHASELGTVIREVD